jgi:hypothetical protein
MHASLLTVVLHYFQEESTYWHTILPHVSLPVKVNSDTNRPGLAELG